MGAPRAAALRSSSKENPPKKKLATVIENWLAPLGDHIASLATPPGTLVHRTSHIAMSEDSAFLARAADVDLEDGEPRNALGGVFRGLTLQGFEESLEGLDHPNYTIIIKKALRKAKRVKKFAHMSLCKKAALVFYTMEDYRRTSG
jgi:hypothetical protein